MTDTDEMANAYKQELPGRQMLDAMALLGWREARPDMNWDAFQPASGHVDVVPANEILARIQAKRQEPEGED